MSELKLAIKHGQPKEVAVENFARAIRQAEQQYGLWIHSVEWSADRTSAVLTGPSYQVTLIVDEEHVHASGQVPFAFRFLEGPIRQYVERMLTQGT
jgi:hypothetical protein